MDSLVDSADFQFKIQQQCMHAFETILHHFPHYKAFYRIARAHFDERRYVRCADILFEKLFLTGRKQRCNNFLEVVERGCRPNSEESEISECCRN